MIVVMLITAVETTGDVFATGEIVEKRIGKDDIARALRADGLATTLGGILNSFPYTCFAENVGLVRLTRIKSRYVVAAAGAIMIILGLLPKAAAIVAGHPAPGARRRRAGHVRHGGGGRDPDAVPGGLPRPPQRGHRRAPASGLAMYVTAEPDVAKAVPDWAQIILGSGITLGSLTAILLNLVFLHIGKSRGPAVAGTPGAAVRLDQVNAMSRDEFVAHLLRPVPGPGTGWSSGPTTSARSATPRTCGGRSRRRCSRRRPRSRSSSSARYPDLGAQSVATGEEGEESLADQSALGLNRLAEKEHQELGDADRGLPRPVRLPADHGRARPGVVRPGPAPRLGAAEQLADPGARRPR